VATATSTGGRWNSIPTAISDIDAPNSLNASVNGPSAAVTASLLWNLPTFALSMAA